MTTNLNDQLFKKVLRIEKLLEQLNLKIDNFMGIEVLDEEEQKELLSIRKEIKNGEYVDLEDFIEE